MSTRKRNTHSLHNNQSGLVSILVSVILILIISLITTSFALLIRREQRQALDRQLSSQAFYAAESGINDAVKHIETSTANYTNCGDFTAGNSNLGNGISYTCVLVNQTPDSLEYGSIETSESTVVRVEAPSTIARIRISWQATDGSDEFATGSDYNLPQSNVASEDDSLKGGTGLIRATLIPIQSGTIRRADLERDSQTVFLYPKAKDAGDAAGAIGSWNAVSNNQSAQGAFVDGKCDSANASVDTPRACNVDITGLNGLSGGTNVFYVRLKSVYKASQVTIQAFSPGSPGTRLNLVGTQAVIDATGKSNDVLRRLQVRVPITTTYEYPDFAVETASDVCKQLLIRPTGATNLCP